MAPNEQDSTVENTSAIENAAYLDRLLIVCFYDFLLFVTVGCLTLKVAKQTIISKFELTPKPRSTQRA